MASETAARAEQGVRAPFARVWMLAPIGLGVLVGIADAYLYAVGHGGADSLLAVWSVASLLLLVLWMSEDSRDRPEVYKPYELGFFVLLFSAAMSRTTSFAPGAGLGCCGWRDCRCCCSLAC